MKFDLRSAISAASRNDLETWVLDYLRGPGSNLPFADGLVLKKRFWDGPVRVHLDQLRRKCGPEPGMPFQVPSASWEKRLTEIIESFVEIESFPPLIVEYRTGDLIVSDGNHRAGAFQKMDLKECWVIIWYPGEAEKQTQ